MAVDITYPVITPMLKVAGGTSGSNVATIIYAVAGGSGADGGIPATGGGGGGAGTMDFSDPNNSGLIVLLGI